MDTLEILETWSEEDLCRLVARLNRDGIVCDEDGLGLSSLMVEFWSEECEEYLMRHGYRGQRIQTCGRFLPAHGAVYALYDSGRRDYEQTFSHLLRVSKGASGWQALPGYPA